LLGITGALGACKSASSPDQVATAFVDAYYIEYDFDRALNFSDGAAKERLIREKHLVDEAREKTALEHARTHVYYGAPEKHAVNDDLAHYTFHLEIHQGSTNLQRTAVVMLARSGDAFRVIQFREESGEDIPNGVRTSSKGSPSALP
jgi:hypothetical protein